MGGGGYWRICLYDVRYPAHRLAWLYSYGVWPREEIDHINGEKSDNRLTNLRLATHSENRANAGPQKNNSSGYKGVGFNKKTGKWRATIRKDRRPISLGYFATAEEAHSAYKGAAVRLFGPYARTE
jgi:hypothetical protein